MAILIFFHHFLQLLCLQSFLEPTLPSSHMSQPFDFILKKLQSFQYLYTTLYVMRGHISFQNHSSYGSYHSFNHINYSLSFHILLILKHFHFLLLVLHLSFMNLLLYLRFWVQYLHLHHSFGDFLLLLRHFEQVQSLIEFFILDLNSPFFVCFEIYILVKLYI